MRKYLGLAIVFLFVAVAGSRADEPTRFGIGVGMNYGKFHLPEDTWPDDSTMYQNPKKGLMITAFVQARISDLAYIEPRLSYIQKGTRLENISFETYAGYVSRGSMQVDAEFIQLSTMFATRFGWNSLRFSPGIGPVIGINTSSQTTYEFDRTSSSPPNVFFHQKVSYENRLAAPVELGVELGMSMEIAATERTSYLINGGYTFGLSDFGSVYGLPPGHETSRGAQLSFAMSFTL